MQRSVWRSLQFWLGCILYSCVHIWSPALVTNMSISVTQVVWTQSILWAAVLLCHSEQTHSVTFIMHSVQSFEVLLRWHQALSTHLQRVLVWPYLHMAEALANCAKLSSPYTLKPKASRYQDTQEYSRLTGSLQTWWTCMRKPMSPWLLPFVHCLGPCTELQIKIGYMKVLKSASLWGKKFKNIWCD